MDRVRSVCVHHNLGCLFLGLMKSKTIRHDTNDIAAAPVLIHHPRPGIPETPAPQSSSSPKNFLHQGRLRAIASNPQSCTAVGCLHAKNAGVPATNANETTERITDTVRMNETTESSTLLLTEVKIAPMRHTTRKAVATIPLIDSTVVTFHSDTKLLSSGNVDHTHSAVSLFSTRPKNRYSNHADSVLPPDIVIAIVKMLVAMQNSVRMTGNCLVVIPLSFRLFVCVSRESEERNANRKPHTHTHTTNDILHRM